MVEHEHSQSAKVVTARPKKSMGIALILTILFGPLGLLYASISAGLIMLIGSFVTIMSGPTFYPELSLWGTDESFGLIDVVSTISWIPSIVLCVLAVRSHNRN